MELLDLKKCKHAEKKEALKEKTAKRSPVPENPGAENDTVEQLEEVDEESEDEVILAIIDSCSELDDEAT